MAESTVVRTKRDHILRATDGTYTYTIAREPGDFTADVPQETVNHFLDRGVLGATPSLRKGDDQPMTLGWSQYITDLGDTAEPEVYQTMMDLVMQYVGGYTDDVWTSTLGTASDVFCVTIQDVCDGASFGESDKTLAYPFTVLRGSIAHGDPDTLNVTGTSYALRPTIT